MIETKLKEDKKNQILDAAFSVFVEKGYSETTMDDIVCKSKMSKGAIYHYYNSKKELFLSLIDHWEVYSFPDFYSKGSNDKSASEILMNLSEVVLNVFNKKKGLTGAPLNFIFLFEAVWFFFFFYVFFSTGQSFHQTNPRQ